MDLLVISTPPHTHGPLTLAGARAGKHVFCEKPLALSLEEADASIEAAARRHTRLSVNYVLRHNPLNRRLHALLRIGVLGPLHNISLENLAADELLRPGHWFWDQALSGGIWAMVRYSGDLIASYHHAFTRPSRYEQTTIRLSCSRGYAVLYGWIPTRLVVEALLDDEGLETMRRWAGVEPQIVERYGGPEREVWAFGAPYSASARIRMELTLPQGKQAVYRDSVRAGMSDFIAAIRDSRAQPEVTADDGRSSLAVALAATRAAETGKWELVSDPTSEVSETSEVARSQDA